ncbi:MAG: hypothetical protein EOP35_08525 [Rubrivivax sp.]|nr:MAG: hypothetical protein EOP35_08525 [Rubrivivax sp.]
MNHDDDPFDAALRRQLDEAAEPDDAGFSLRVMAALPPPAPRRRARRVRQLQWLAISLAACGAALLLGTQGDAPQALAGMALMALLIFWAVPSRWSRG